MANIQVIGLKDNGDGTGQLEAAQTATSDTYAFPNYTGYIKAAGTSAASAVASIPNTDVSGLGTMSTQAASSVAITGGTINGTTVGATTAATGRFTTVESTVATGTAPFTVASTTNVANLNASSLNGATFAAPGSIGSTTASTGKFTSVETTGTIGAGVAPASGANITIKAGSATVAPLQLTTATSALLTTPVAGVVENDTAAIYYTADTNAKRGIIPAFQLIRLASAYTTVSGSTALQQLFNTTAGGAVTVTAGAVYEFECVFGLSSLSATSGNVGFGFGGGTATFTSVWYTASCNKGNNMQGTNGTAATNTNISAASTTTSANAIVKGILVINAGGTIVPSFSVTVAAAAVVAAGSFFKLTNIGSSATVGAWT